MRSLSLLSLLPWAVRCGADTSHEHHATYVVITSAPVCRAQPVVAVRFCPVLFAAELATEHAASGEAPAAMAPAANACRLPYRLVLAVATLDSVVRALAATWHKGTLCLKSGAWACSVLEVTSRDSAQTHVSLLESISGLPSAV